MGRFDDWYRTRRGYERDGGHMREGDDIPTERELMNWREANDYTRDGAADTPSEGHGQLESCWRGGGAAQECETCGGTGIGSARSDPGPVPPSETRDTALTPARAGQMLHSVLALDGWRLASLVEDRDTPGAYLMLLAGKDRATAYIHHEGDWRAFCARTEAAEE